MLVLSKVWTSYGQRSPQRTRGHYLWRRQKGILSYFVFLEFILTWDISQINETILCIFTDDACWISYILIFRSFHAQDLIFTRIQYAGVAIFTSLVLAQNVKFINKILIANYIKIKSWARKWSKQLNIWTSNLWHFFIALRDILYVK